MLMNKFYVLTACEAGKYSYGNVFVDRLTSGVKTKGIMPADTNKDKFVTLDELYRHMAKKDNQKIRNTGEINPDVQHTQVYPANSGFRLFYRK